MEVLFSDAFLKSLKKHSSIKKAIKKRVDMIIENPIALTMKSGCSLIFLP